MWRQLCREQPGHVSGFISTLTTVNWCAPNRERNLHKSYMFLATTKELLQGIVLVFCRFLLALSCVLSISFNLKIIGKALDIVNSKSLVQIII